MLQHLINHIHTQSSLIQIHSEINKLLLAQLKARDEKIQALEAELKTSNESLEEVRSGIKSLVNNIMPK